MAMGGAWTAKTYLNLIKLTISNDYYVSAAFICLLLLVTLVNRAIFSTIFSFITAAPQKMKFEASNQYISRRILMRRIDLCSQNYRQRPGSTSLHNFNIPTLKATSVAQPRGP